MRRISGLGHHRNPTVIRLTFDFPPIIKGATLKQSHHLKYLKGDLSAGLVVFLVALPLCLGISLASGAPLFSGIISGVIGGIVVGFASQSNVNVSGPAASVAVVVLTGIATLGSYEAVLVAVVIAGVIQIIMGFIGLGVVAYFFPSAMIKGILASIGLILILKQIPHALGDDGVFEGFESFYNPDGFNSFSEIGASLGRVHFGAVLVTLLSLVAFVWWDRPALKEKSPLFKFFPAALLSVTIGILVNELLFRNVFPNLVLDGSQLVQLPVARNASEFFSYFATPKWSFLSDKRVYGIAMSIAFIASLESLLSTEAGDKLDPLNRRTPTNRELKAQGIGNIIAGLVGGLPITAVIVRTSANVSSGGRTKVATMVHGAIMLLCVIAIPGLLNRIPLASLAAVLFVIGYKLTSFGLYSSLYRRGARQFVPFIATIIGVMFTDLITGVIIGGVCSIFILLRDSYRTPFFKSQEHHEKTHQFLLSEEVTFLNKAAIMMALENIDEGHTVIIDGSKSVNIDDDVIEIMDEFKTTAAERKIQLQFVGLEAWANLGERKAVEGVAGTGEPSPSA